MTSVALFTMPDIFAEPQAGDVVPPRGLLQDLSTEVGNQLLRKFMASFGSGVALADGVALYAGQVDAGRSVYNVTHNKDGSRNNSPVKFGFVFESLVTGEQNRNAVINGTGERFSRVDDLYFAKNKDGETLPHSELDDIATFNNQHTDVVGYTADGIRVKQQLKVVKNTEILLEERYTVSDDPHAPDEIVVPADEYERHEACLKKISQDANASPERRARANAALGKLRASTVTRAETENTAAYCRVVGQAAADAVQRAGERTLKGLLPEAGLLVVGGAVWELRDAAEHPETLSLWQRIERFFGVVWKKLVSSCIVRAGKEFALETLNVLLGAMKSMFKSAGSLLMTLGKGIGTVWESLYDYLTGKIRSFSQLVSIILKTLTTVGIGTLAYIAEQQLTALGMPGLIAGLLSAALAGIAVVFANRTIDASLFALVNLFSGVEAAKMRRERIEELCREAIPRLAAEREALARTIEKYYKERASLFGAAFYEFKTAVASRDSVGTFMALESINQAFGCTLGWRTEEEFDAMMESDEPLVL